jgi:D-galactarolactone cycloisomerase
VLIRRVTAFAVKAGQVYAMSGGVSPGSSLPGSEYFRFGGYPQLYSTRSQAVLVRVETDSGLVGWGEAQAPIGTEVILTIVKEVLAPAVLGRDAEATGLRYHEMYETMRVRGQIGGYQQDAIAAVDTALWDLRGRVVGRSLAELLGGRRHDRLPAYVTGLREKTPEGRQAEAAGWAAQGLGVKPCLGLGPLEDAREVERLRSAMGDEARLMVDGMWGYTYPEAVRAGRAFEQYDVAFLESPLLPEDVAGHARLARDLDLAVAVGEPLRTRFAFLPWFEREALDIAQPDLMRNGVTETLAIAELAYAFNRPVALHTGVVTVVGMSASWQVASTLPTFLVQELQPVMLDTFNPWLAEPLRVEDGAVVVPTRPGLGLEIDEERVAAMATSTVTAAL